MVKSTDSANALSVWHQNLTATSEYHVTLNTSSAGEVNYQPTWSTAPSSTIIYCGADNTGGGGGSLNYICYAWKAVAGVSAFGTYTGNGGAATNTITYTGSNSFTARFIMIKNIDSANNWIIKDSFREAPGTELLTFLKPCSPMIFIVLPLRPPLLQYTKYVWFLSNSLSFSLKLSP